MNGIQKWIHPGARRAELPGYREGALSGPAMGARVYTRGGLRAVARRLERETGLAWKTAHKKSAPFRARIVDRIEAANKRATIIAAIQNRRIIR